MIVVPATITTELLAHADGRPIAYIDATAIAIFTYQQPDGTYVIDICTRNDIAPGQLRPILDGEPLLRVEQQRHEQDNHTATEDLTMNGRT